ncbi:TadE/TadG family type IV pilus assembly protein [Bacillus sp. AFS041924]|uniref:TadE/TadG family type IV pilus assembly protein n=1 Tax=Bacillus sp. AFS041924 TaxID=2033503 RepID=UPI000BFCD9D5|nr:TadE/TadG family type IV pilus assembly protein [Bacillus sp. AFS041924]PGS51940.1 pilus assembly protein TadE [Bacillus sp. AFS041924]
MKSEKGQSLVEFALVLPLLAMLILAIVDFGRIYHVYLTLDHAGREAARAASIGKDDTTIKSVAVNDASSINLTTDQVSISPSTRSSGSDVRITITYPVDFLTPVIGQIIGTFDLKDTTVMRVE